MADAATMSVPARGVRRANQGQILTAQRGLHKVRSIRGAATMIAHTTGRVPRNTSAAVNQEIRRQTESRLEWHRRDPHAIPQRLEALDREWDIERALETGSAALTL